MSIFCNLLAFFRGSIINENCKSFSYSFDVYIDPNIRFIQHLIKCDDEA